MPNSQNNSSGDEKIAQNIAFINSLVMAMTGLSVLEIPENQRDSVCQDCLEVFMTYVCDWTASKYGPKEAMRIKALNLYGDLSILDKFAGLEDKLSEAFEAFLVFLETENQLEVPALANSQNI